MPSKGSIELQFPIGGVARILGYQAQSATGVFTCPDALNAVPFDSAEGRARGGSRDGSRPAYYIDLGGAIRLLASIDYTIAGTLNKLFEDSFDSASLGSRWSAIGSTTIMPTGDEYAGVTVLQTGAAALEDVGILANSAYTVAIYIAPFRHAFHGIYRIYLRMNTATPAPETSGVVVELSMVGDAITAVLLSYTTGTRTVLASYFGLPQSFADGGWLRAVVDETGTDTVTVYWGITQILTGNVGGTAAGRVGFGATCLTPDGRCIIEQFRFAYTGNASTIIYNRQLRSLIAVSSGLVWQIDTDPADMLKMAQQSGSAPSLATDRDLTAAQYGQRLYIADNSDPIATGTGTINGTSFDSASYSDWTTGTTLGAAFTSSEAANNYVLEILTVAAATARVGAYKFDGASGVAAGNLTLTTSGSSASTSCTFQIVRAPKIYTPSSLSLTIWTAATGKGLVPNGSIIVRYRERPFLCGGNMGIQWVMGRQGDWTDFNYGGTIGDAKRAIAGSLADAGVPGDIPTAAAAGGDDYLVVWCRTSTWAIFGDPAYTGQIRNIDRTVGCVGLNAWCSGPGNTLYWLAHSGLYMMGNGVSVPTPLSGQKIPRELLEVDASLYSVSLAYDQSENRVYIFISDAGSNRTGRHWCFDVKTASFWPLSFPAANQPTAARWYTSDIPQDSALILGCRDGYLRRFDRYCDTDDGNSFDSYVTYGPIQAGSGMQQGRVDAIIADVALNSRDVTWQLRVGANPEAAFRATYSNSGTWEEGMNHKNRPRKRGGGFCLKVGRFASGTAGWAMERITVLRTVLGMRR